jgi:hypothetical protein
MRSSHYDSSVLKEDTRGQITHLGRKRYTKGLLCS